MATKFIPSRRRFASQSSDKALYGFRRSPVKSSKKTASQKALELFKEWGGAASLLIAVLYTFPISLLDRVTASKDKAISQSRQTIADGSSMMIERIMNIAKITDPRSLETINNMYNIKFYNLVYTNKDLLQKNVLDLRSSDLATYAGLLSTSGLVEDALYYYDQSIRKAKQERVPYINILRDKALALTMAGPSQNISAARESFKETLTLIANLQTQYPQQTARQFTLFLSELAYLETSYGDWACGSNLHETARDYMQKILQYDQSIGQNYQWMEQNYSSAQQKQGQSANGCNYKVPDMKM